MARLRITRWREDLHPRAGDGEFTSGRGGGSHPSPPAGGGHRGAAAASMDETQYAEHTGHVGAALGGAIKAGEETHVKHTLGGDGVTYTPERARMHKQIVDDLYGRAGAAKSEGKAVIAGGRGAGKSTVLREHAGINPDDYVTVNADDVKELMAARGMVPETEGLSPMDRAVLVHAETAQITNMLAARAYADRKNVMWDVTMSRAVSVRNRISELHARGYTNIQGVFVGTPGGGPGTSADPHVFDSLRSQFDGWQVFDNSGTAPVRRQASYDDEEFDPGLEIERALDRTRRIRDTARRQHEQRRGARS